MLFLCDNYCSNHIRIIINLGFLTLLVHTNLIKTSTTFKTTRRLLKLGNTRYVPILKDSKTTPNPKQLAPCDPREVFFFQEL